MRRCVVLSLLLVFLSLPSLGLAQPISRDGYIVRMPEMSKVVSQTLASERLHLFGNRGTSDYRDADLNGIDDARAERLLQLATRFAPILRRNNFSAPRDFERSLGSAAWLQRDIWRGGRRERSDSIWFSGPRRLMPLVSQIDSAAQDQKLLDLVRMFSPSLPERRFVPAETDSQVVLFLDYPGEDQRSWRRVYQDERDTRAYVHTFIHENGATGDARYALVLQYWFFYPFNDGTNNHEGDWEHISVIITTEAKCAATDLGAARMTEAELQGLLDGSMSIDSTAIAAVEYFFHETYVVLDYVAARRTALVKSPTRPRLTRFYIWHEPDFVEKSILNRLANPSLATHPIGYIGGNNRGPDELTSIWPRFGAGYNRNAHGTYPFPGTCQAVGPLGSTEQLSGAVVPALVSTDSAATFEDKNFELFARDQLTLLPDWERIADLTFESAAARAAWAWLLLPIRWGYPASQSPGAGLIPHTDMGEVAPEGPAYQPTWNRLASATGWRAYDPHVLRVLMVPVTPWARMKNGWGVLNAPLALIGFIPGWSVVLTQFLPWATGTMHLFGAPPAKNYYPTEPPFRFTSVGIGVGFMKSGDRSRFASLLPSGSDSVSLRDAAEVGSRKRGELDTEPAERLWLNLFYGRRVSVENTYSRTTGVLSYEDFTTTDGDEPRARAAISLQELTGGFRINGWSSNDDGMQLFARAGWAWTWYELTNVDVDGTQVDYRLKRGYAPTLWPSRKWWPNTWYAGAGMELFTPKSVWLFGRLGLGARVEATSLTHRLRARSPGDDHFGWARRSDYAVSLLVAW